MITAPAGVQCGVCTTTPLCLCPPRRLACLPSPWRVRACVAVCCCCVTAGWGETEVPMDVSSRRLAPGPGRCPVVVPKLWWHGSAINAGPSGNQRPGPARHDRRTQHPTPHLQA